MQFYPINQRLAKKHFKAIMSVLVSKKYFMKNSASIKYLSFLGFFWVGLGWLALILTFFNFFYISLIVTVAIIMGVILIYIAKINRHKFVFQKNFFFVFGFSFLLVILVAHYTTPSVFSGRDQGSLSNTAINLSQNHQLKFNFPAEKEFFKIYGAGKALNFPGFNYDKAGNLITHFPLGYTSWLAIFYSLFGLNGLIVANSLTLFLFFIFFYLTARNYLSSKPALITFLVIASSFIFSWLAKYTLSENLALFLVWFGIWEFLLFLKSQEKFYLILSLLTFGLLTFCRIESLAFLAMLLLVLFFQLKKAPAFFNLIFNKKILLTLGAILFFFLLSLKINTAFYIVFLKGFLNSLHFYKNDLVNSSYPLAGTFYLLRVFALYALINYLLIGLAGIFYFLKNKKFQLLIPFFILLPAFIYLLNPSISLDHPWILRRYVFSIIPVTILYSMIFLATFFQKKRFYFYSFSILLIFSNLLVFMPFLKKSANKNLLPQIKNISTLFQKNDLILVDREATGNPWAMMDEPLYSIFGKQAVYFFNPDDLAKINLQKFHKVYFVIPDQRIGFYQKDNLIKKIIPIQAYSFKLNSFNIIPSTNKKYLYQQPIKFPSYQKNYSYGEIYLLTK